MGVFYVCSTGLRFICVEISAVQVKPPSLSIGMSCSMEHLGTVLDVTSSPTSKRPRIKEEEIDETWSSSTEESAVSDFTYESDVSQQDSET